MNLEYVESLQGMNCFIIKCITDDIEGWQIEMTAIKNSIDETFIQHDDLIYFSVLLIVIIMESLLYSWNIFLFTVYVILCEIIYDGWSNNISYRVQSCAGCGIEIHFSLLPWQQLVGIALVLSNL